MKQYILKLSLLLVICSPLGITMAMEAVNTKQMPTQTTNVESVNTAKSEETKISIEQQARKLIEEFLNTTKNPKKNYGAYITELCAILKTNPKYKLLVEKLGATTKLKRHTQISNQLLKLKTELPAEIYTLLQAKGGGPLLKILKARVTAK